MLSLYSVSCSKFANKNLPDFVSDSAISIESSLFKLSTISKIFILEYPITLILIYSKLSLIAASSIFKYLFALPRALIISPFPWIDFGDVFICSNSMGKPIWYFTFIVRILSNKATVTRHIIFFPSSLVETTIFWKDKYPFTTSDTLFISSKVGTQIVAEWTLISFLICTQHGQISSILDRLKQFNNLQYIRVRIRKSHLNSRWPHLTKT